MMKHRMLLLLLALSLVCGLCACAAPTEADAPAPTEADASARTDEPPAAQEEAAPSVSEGAETVVQFTGEAVSVSGSGCEADGTALTISEGGVYRLSGSCADGSVKVKNGTTGVTLILDALTLTSADTASITCGTILAAGGSAGMGMKLSVSQPYVTFGQSGGMQPRGAGADALIAADSTLAISDGTDTLFSMEAPCGARFVFFSAPELTADGSYTLLADEESAGTADAQTSESQSGFGDMPGGRPGSFDPNGEAPAGMPNGETPPALPDDGGTPPEKPDGAPEAPASGSV